MYPCDASTVFLCPLYDLHMSSPIAVIANIWEISSDAHESHSIPLHHLSIYLSYLTRLLRRREILNTKNYEFISVAILLLWQHHQDLCAARLTMLTVGNVNIALSEGS